LVLDDGFQHRRLARDLDIVLVDCTCPFGHGYMFPRGMLREPISALSRADLVVLTRFDLCSKDDRQEIRKRAYEAARGKPVVSVAYRSTALCSKTGASLPAHAIAGQRVLGFCGIGNPRAFWQTLRDLRCNLDPAIAFPDHHHYTHDDLAGLAESARCSQVELAICTQKDLVKIPGATLGDCPLYALRIEAVIDDPNGVLETALTRLIEPPETARAA
jgi:tetraacyldisaccharide 4'-kinase